MGCADEEAAEVAAMQFAGGRSIARVAELWERDAEWVEGAVRQALLKLIPKRDGGMKPSRTEERAQARLRGDADSEQAALEFEDGGIAR